MRTWDKLSATGVRGLKTPGKYYDGGGLMLSVAPTKIKGGVNKAWLFRFQLDKRERVMGLGIFVGEHPWNAGIKLVTEWHNLHMNNTSRRSRIGDGSAHCPVPLIVLLARSPVERVRLSVGRVEPDAPQRH